MPTYRMGEKRKGKLPLHVKLSQALGAFPTQGTDWAFATFLLLFYNQVLGLPAGLASAALMIAVLVDAITDPAVGSFSDGLVTRIGRRHPLMYGSIVPLAIILWALFNPPSGLSDYQLFAWLVGTAVGSRVALTFFAIPWVALFPELTEDYVERSEIFAYRWTIGIVSVALFGLVTWGLVFRDQGDGPGQLLQSNYAVFGIVLAVFVAGFASLSASLTHGQIRYLRQPTAKTRMSALKVVRDFMMTFRSRSFLYLFLGLLISNTITGAVNALRIYTYTFFWGLEAKDLAYVPLSGVGALFALVAIPKLNAHFEKKHILIAGVIANLMDNFIIINLRFLHILPENGEPALVWILVANEALHMFLVVLNATMFYSMVADIIDEEDLETGVRREGVFSAAIGFSGKAISGIGVLAAGVILQFVIRIPEQSTVADLSENTIVRLGLVMGYALPALYFIPAWIIHYYRLDRARHSEVIAKLNSRSEGS